MFKIVKATVKNAKVLSKIGKASFLVAHGHSAPKEHITNYVAHNFSEKNFISELENP